MEYKALAFLEEVAATIELSFDDTDGTLDVVMKNSDGEQVASGSVTVNAWKSPVISATATVDGGTGTPSVEVAKSGTADSTTFTFKFHNLKGADGSVGSLYAHNIVLVHSTSGLSASCQIISNSNTAFTKSTFGAWLQSKGCNSTANVYFATGKTSDFVIHGLYYSSGTIYGAYKETSSVEGQSFGSTNVTLKDTVVQIL